MERLTRRTKEGKALLKDDTIYLSDVIKKCAEYEDLEEQGLLLRLPCRIGNTVCLPNEIWTFASKEEAEQALEKMEKENGNVD